MKDTAMVSTERYVTEGKVIASTLKSRLIHFTEADEDHWVPLSQLEMDELPEGDNLGQINMSAWIAKKLGLI